MTEQIAKIILKQYLEDGGFTSLKLCFDFFGKTENCWKSRRSQAGASALLLSPSANLLVFSFLLMIRGEIVPATAIYS